MEKYEYTRTFVSRPAKAQAAYMSKLHDIPLNYVLAALIEHGVAMVAEYAESEEVVIANARQIEAEINPGMDE